jgi:hypothetical protein
LVSKRNQAAISILKEVFAMNETDYNARLYEKMKAEQDKYRDWLLQSGAVRNSQPHLRIYTDIRKLQDKTKTSWMTTFVRRELLLSYMRVC